ncbi:MAG: M15 family metallopeptidase [Nocardioides sp.]
MQVGQRRRHACSGAAAAVVLLVATACGETSSAGPDQIPNVSAPPTSQAPITDVPVGDPDRAVPPPGKLTGRLETADILVLSKETLSEEMVARINEVEGVEAVEQFALAQVSLENKVYDLAAVDPSTYRRFTPGPSAFLQEQWDRVAGGEMAVLDGLRKRLPIDEAGYLKLGMEEVAADVHVGAYAPQMLQVDAVVNRKWGEELGLTPGNALAISTRITSPQDVSGPLRELVGDGVSVQNLDVVAREGLDPGAVQTAILVGSFSEAVGTFNYSVLSGGRIAPDPAWVSSNIATEVVPILGSVTCNKAVFPQLKAALAEIVGAGLADEINPGEYAGCYYPRFIAGSSQLSNHAFGLAFDINVPGNQRGTVGEIDRTVVAIFKRWGFSWGGDWRYTDPMHFELNAIVNPG